MPCRSLGCHPLARTGSAHFRAQGTELAPLFPEVEEESLTGFQGEDKLRWFSTPSPLGEGGAQAPGEGETPVITGNRDDLAVPPHPPFQGTFSPGRRRALA